ncbi:hypothetical protein MTR67_034501 [Solanum verrucosum]|uniref:Uncharacterized protein n=1 Tax=Solanum verrucosum TaxID=315347 RepID=A0AAF0ZIS0_SOLVR|nr:hypothetical protein MTR67_034501 [Solanum verrucosum]
MSVKDGCSKSKLKSLGQTGSPLISNRVITKNEIRSTYSLCT